MRLSRSAAAVGPYCSPWSLLLLVEDLEAAESAGEPQPEVEDFLTVTDRDDRFEDPEPGTVHEGRTHLF